MVLTNEQQKARKREAVKRWKENNREKALATNREASKKWAKANASKRVKSSIEWQRKNATNRTRVLHTNIGTRSRAKNLGEWLTLEELTDLLKPMICEVTGMKLDWNDPDWMPSPDRKNQKQGYLKDNVRIVSWAYNRARHSSTDAKILEMARALVARYGL